MYFAYHCSIALPFRQCCCRRVLVQWSSSLRSCCWSRNHILDQLFNYISRVLSYLTDYWKHVANSITSCLLLFSLSGMAWSPLLVGMIGRRLSFRLWFWSWSCQNNSLVYITGFRRNTPNVARNRSDFFLLV